MDNLETEWPTIPDYCEPLVGWRRWNIHEGKLTGCGIGGGVTWPVKQQLEAGHEHSWGAEKSSPSCLGSPCDRIVEHQFGLRSQYAYPKKLVACSTGCDLAVLAETYGITYEESESWKSVIQNAESLPTLSPYPAPSTYLWWRNQSAYSVSPLSWNQLTSPFTPPSSNLLIRPSNATCKHDGELTPWGRCDGCGLYLTQQELREIRRSRRQSHYYDLGPKPLIINVGGA